MTTPTPNRRWYHPTPARFFIGLLAVQVFLLLSEHFQWFWFNERKGWTVLIALGVVLLAVLVMLLWGLVCLLLRRRFQFAVRSLLVFLVAVSVPLGWFAWEMRKARRQREAVERIVELGGSVGYDYQVDANGDWVDGAESTTPIWLRRLLGDDFFCDVMTVDCQLTAFGDNDVRHLQRLANLRTLTLPATQITDKGLAQLGEMTRLEALNLSGTKVTDAGLEHLKGLTSLSGLNVRNTHVTDAGLEHLKGLANLEWLDLGGTLVTNAGLEHLKELANLEWLDLGGTAVADAGLKHLKWLPSLERLGLSGTQVTDAGLKHLMGITNLKRLVLSEVQITDFGAEGWRTQVTNEGVTRLQKTLPNCEIYWH
jgi:hypothetical protein